MVPPIRRAVILAAGRGTRMMPLTATCPKPLIPVAGIPILERILRALHRTGIDEAVIVHAYLGQMIIDYFGDGARMGMRLHYREQQQLRGTVPALLQARDLCGEDPFLLHWGDILVDPANYAVLNEAYRRDHAPAAVLGLNWLDDPSAGAAVYRDGERVTAIVEKPDPGTSATHWNNAGVMLLGPQIWRYLPDVPVSPRGEYEIADAIRLMIAHGEVVVGQELTGLWSDIGTPETLAALNSDPRLASW